MKPIPADSSFPAELRSPADSQGEDAWFFVVLPKSESDRFPRRGRTGMQGSINGHPFEAILEPDGQLSHWFKIPETLLESFDIAPGSKVMLEVWPLENELEPQVPTEFLTALDTLPKAKATWENTTTVARIDWIHWIDSARQEKTRLTRIANACDMLAAGKKRVCCFDSSGYYSKSLQAPKEVT